MKLTPMQLEVLEQLVQGKSNREIGRTLFRSEKTIKAHLQAIFRVMRVENRVEAVVLGLQLGIIELPVLQDQEVA